MPIIPVQEVRPGATFKMRINAFCEIGASNLEEETLQKKKGMAVVSIDLTVIIAQLEKIAVDKPIDPVEFLRNLFNVLQVTSQ